MKNKDQKLTISDSDSIRNTKENFEDILSYSRKDTTIGIPSLEWNFLVKGEAEFGAPQTIISLYVNGVKHFIKESHYGFSVIPAEEIESTDIKDVLIACRGWWAGAGEEYWAVRNNNEIIIMMRGIGEGTEYEEEPPGKQVKVKTIPLDK